MQIDKNTIATLTYQIYLDGENGELIESADIQKPRSMVFGYDRMLPGFESNLTGLYVGKDFSFLLNEEDAFGSYQDELLIKVPKSAFVMDGKVREDLIFLNNEIGMIDNHGNPVKGKIIEINADDVKMDFNHQLAGRKLYVTGSVLDIRPVTDDDLNPKGGCCGGSCGCGSTKDEHDHGHHHGEEDCEVCGNPPELQGQGIGSCKCV